MTAPFLLLRREKKTEHTMSELAAGGAEPAHPCPAQSLRSPVRRRACAPLSGAEPALPCPAQSLRSPVRSARLHSLCSAHSADSPVEAGIFAVF